MRPVTALRDAARRLAYVTWQYRPVNPGAEAAAAQNIAQVVGALAAVGLAVAPEDGPIWSVLAYEDAYTDDPPGLLLAAVAWDHLEFPRPVVDADGRPWGVLLGVEREAPIVWALVDKEVPDGHDLSLVSQFDGGRMRVREVAVVPTPAAAGFRRWGG